VQHLQEPADTGLVNEITKVAETKQALRWLAQQLAWERVLTGLRSREPAGTITRTAA
jgi:hypothetical protein